MKSSQEKTKYVTKKAVNASRQETRKEEIEGCLSPESADRSILEDIRNGDGLPPIGM